MRSFLNQVAEYIHQNYKENPDELCIVLPNKRGALFLKQNLANVFKKNIWLPKIISAEDLIAELSGLTGLEELELLCRLYESYLEILKDKNPEPFDSFAKWGNLILQDFNEIDRYLADAHALYQNLKDIKEIENWSLAQKELTDFQKNYIEFMGNLGAIYKHFTTGLLREKKGYQGLAYKTAVQNYQSSSFVQNYHHILFCGFNALNAAETILFSKLCVSGKATMLWDADNYYLQDQVQEAGLFLRRNKKNFELKELNFTGNYFKENKHIDVIAVPKQIGQAQSIHNIINKLLDQGISPDSIAVVLANEKLLWPVLKMLPERIQHVNITMEYPIRYTSPYNFIDLLLKIHSGFEKQNRKTLSVYYKEFLSILRHTFFSEYMEILGVKNITSIIDRILEKNYAFITENLLKELFAENYNIVEHIFKPWNNSSEAGLRIKLILERVKNWHLSGELNSYKSVELEYLEVLIKSFNRVNDFINQYTHFETIKAFKVLFNQIVGASSAAFIGEPLRGLQIMGVLETRTLDFDNVIFVSVNEGVLPSGKTINSFIPNDLKRYFGLPLYGDKDAIYAYHFYRLLQRAHNVFITYDTETDTFGKGEKSRFVSQLQFELPIYNPNIQINEYIAQSKSALVKSNSEIIIPKSDLTLEKIVIKATNNDQYSGLSPSSLLAYKSCSLKFYFRYGAGLKETLELEESAEANTFGSILHGALEKLYAPFVGKSVSINQIQLLKHQAEKAVNESFLYYFSESEAFLGKNLLQQNALKIYVDKLLNLDIDLIQEINKKEIKIIGVEKEFCSDITVQYNGIDTKVFIKGTADRLDDYDGKFRIIDYKSSVKDRDKFEFTGFETLFSDSDYDKMFQLFMYAWMAWKNKLSVAETLMPCIIPFKVFEKQPRVIKQNKQPLVFTDALLIEFENHLKVFIELLLNPTIPFHQTDNEDTCIYCAYNTICNKVI